METQVRTQTAPPAATPHPSPLEDPEVQRFLQSPPHAHAPTRMGNWARRNEVHTLRDLALRSPTALLGERNLGRKSIRDTDAVFRRYTGMSWEALRQHLQQAHVSNDAPSEPADEPTTPQFDASTWDRCAETMPDVLRALPVSRLDLPTRMDNFCAARGIETIGALLEWTAADLTAERNMGRRSVKQTLAAMENLAEAATEQGDVQRVVAPSLDDYPDWYALLRSRLAGLPPTDRLIITRRAGVHAEIPTLNELGETLGVSRERVRQIESRAVERLRREWWVEPFRCRILDALVEGALPLADLTHDSFFEGADEREPLFDFLLERVLEDVARVVEVDEQKVVATASPKEVEQALSDMRADLSRLVFPVAEGPVLELARKHADRVCPGLEPHFRRELQDHILVADTADGRVVTGHGRTRDARLLAFLRAAPAPVPIADLEERFGRGRWPEETIYAERGVLALPQHFPDFHRWSRRLVPLCVATMMADDPSRQWSATELLDAISEQAQLPEWLGHWPLAGMLRLSDQVRYLGRLRVALEHDEAPTERRHVKDVAEAILKQHGRPMERGTLFEALRAEVSVSDIAFAGIVHNPPFLQCDDASFGLLARDLPGGLDAISEAVDALEDELESRQRGLAPLEALEVVHDLGGDYTQWTPAMVRSVARHAGLFRLNRSGSIGLADWDDERVPTRRGVLRALLDARQGRVSVQDAQDALALRFGSQPNRMHLNNLATSAGAQLRKHEIVDVDTASASIPPPPQTQPDPRTLPGFPPRAVPTFQALLEEPLADPPALRAAIDAHVEEFMRHHRLNEFLDPQEARALAQSSHRLLDHIAAPDTPEPTRRLAQAAIRYFVLSEEGDSDFEVGGLDDDIKVMNAVAGKLGLEDCKILLS